MPHPCRCRICAGMDWETHVLLGELARGEELTQAETLRAAVHTMARSRGLLGRRRDDAYKRRIARDRQRAPLKSWVHAGIQANPSLRHPNGNGECPVRPSNRPVRGVEPEKLPRYTPPGPNGRNRQRFTILSDWERGYLSRKP